MSDEISFGATVPAEEFDELLRLMYRPVAITYRDSDILEYVNCDTMTISERVDENLSILRDKDGKIVGMVLANWSKIRR